MSTPIAAALVDELFALDARTLGEGAMAKAGLCFVDFLSCAFAGLRLPWARQAIAAASPWPAAHGAGVIGTGLVLPPGEAGFVNSVMAASASRTDMHPVIASHIAPIAFPAALACAALRPVSGAEFLAAIVTAYEAEARLGRLLVDDRFRRHFRATSVLGSLGAAVVAARLLGLDTAQAVNAVSISVNAAAGLMEWGHSGEVELFYQPANAVRAAISAALLARVGATASATVLEGPGGLLAAFGERADAARLLQRSSAGWEIELVDFKPVPACVFVQAAAFAAANLVRGNGRVDAEVKEIRLRTFAAAIDYPGCDNAGPIESIQAARMSLQYTVASVLARGELTDANFSEIADPATRRLLPKIRLEATPEFGAAFPARQGADVEVQFSDGRRLAGRVDDVPGADAPRVHERFRQSARACLDAAQVADLEATCKRCAELDNVQALLPLLAATSHRT